MLQRISSRMRNASAARDLFALVEQSSDPFSHPMLKAMTTREFSDIPFPRLAASRARRSTAGKQLIAMIAHADELRWPSGTVVGRGSTLNMVFHQGIPKASAAMETFQELVDLARSCMRQARLASTKQVAQTLRKMAKEYQARAAKLDRGKFPDIGEDDPFRWYGT